MKIGILIVLLVMVSVLAPSAKGQTEETVRRRAKLYEPAILSIANRYGIDPRVLWTIAYLESGFNPDAVSYKNGVPCAFGLMQFIPSTARKYVLENVHDPQQALDAGARYLVDLMKHFDGRTDLVLAAYNAGEGTVQAFRDGKRLLLPNGKIVNPGAIRTGGIPPYRETQRYVKRGLSMLVEMARSSVRVETKVQLRPTAESVYSAPLIPSSSKIELRAKTQSFYVN